MHSWQGLKQRLKLQSHHGEWQSLEQRSEGEVLGDIKQGWRSEKIINSQFHNSDMTSISSSPSNITPTANNVQMDVDSDLEAEQVAWELVQAQEWLCVANEAQEGIGKSGKERRRREKKHNG